MPVISLTEFEKNIIAHQYSVGKIKVQELADNFATSRRTIGRVLEEKGVAPVKRPRRTKIVNPVSQPLPELSFGEKFKCLIKAVVKTTKNKFNVSAKQ